MTKNTQSGTASNEPQLKPCPFCGGNPTLRRCSTATSGLKYSARYIIECKDCRMATTKEFETVFDIDLTGALIYEKDGRKEAIEAWNRRKVCT